MTKDLQDLTCMYWQKLDEYEWGWILRVIDQCICNISYDDTKPVTLRTRFHGTGTHWQRFQKTG